MTDAQQLAARRRLGGLWRFAVAISVLNVFGHAVLGFEQPWIVPFVALASGYATELVLELVDAWSRGTRPRFVGTPKAFVEFMLPAHISSLAIGMLVYGNEHLWVTAFTCALAIASKYFFRAPVGVAIPGRPRATRHFFNPSNFAITISLLAFPWLVGAPPYQFVENVTGGWDVALPMLVFTTGSLLNSLFTKRVPLIAAWLAGFAAQALFRSAVNGTPFEAGLFPMTGLAFILFTFYMVTDPGTTPEHPWCQAAFGAGVAVLYGLIVQAHVVFGLYYALTLTSGIRGLWLYYRAWQPRALADASLATALGTTTGQGA